MAEPCGMGFVLTVMVEELFIRAIAVGDRRKFEGDGVRQVGDLPRIGMAEPCGMEFVLIMVVLNLSPRQAAH